MKVKFLILYSWWVRTITFFLPEVPIVQSFRGWLYSFGMKQCGKRFRVSYNVMINHLETLSVGDNVYFACGTVVTGGGNVFVGTDTLIGPYVLLASSKHVFHKKNFLGGYEHGEIVIEEGCWIGGHATLIMGTHIHSSSVVGAGSVCNRDYIDSGVLIGGMPATVIKRLAL
ncbi:MAG: acyltransferase [Cyclobacteriaceae bacterium]|nr:acyltransferase [Cyclobacteriaceae bacterium]